MILVKFICFMLKAGYWFIVGLFRMVTFLLLGLMAILGA